MALVRELDFSYMEPETGHVWMEIQRTSLQQGVLDIINTPLPNKPEVILHVNTAASGIDYQEGTITLEDGKVIKKDVIVAADGIHVSELNPNSNQ